MGSRRIIEVWPAMYSPATAPCMSRSAGEEAEAIDDGRHLVLQHADARLAAIQRFERGEASAIALDASASLKQQSRPFDGRRARPGLKRLRRGGDGRIHLLQASFRQGTIVSSVFGIDYRLRRIGAATKSAPINIWCRA